MSNLTYQNIIRGAEEIPTGIIIPYNTDDGIGSSPSVPSGWELFTNSGSEINKYLVGAGDLYSIGSTGGNTSINLTTSTDGSHTGTQQEIDYASGPGSDFNPSSSGDHTHTINFTPTLGYRKVRFIKSIETQYTFPKNSIFLSYTDLSNYFDEVTDINFTNKYLKFSNDYIDYSDSYLTRGTITSTDGSHWHLNGVGTFPKTATGTNVTITASQYSGSHFHNINSLTLNEDHVKKIYLSAWSNAYNKIKSVPGIIAMWESLTPPSGYKICDGTSGTMDLRNYFVYITSKTNHGTKDEGLSGQNGLIVSYGLDINNFTHNHHTTTQALSSSGTILSYHSSESFPHSHSNSSSNLQINYTPPYYALIFIQKT